MYSRDFSVFGFVSGAVSILQPSDARPLETVSGALGVSPSNTEDREGGYLVAIELRAMDVSSAEGATSESTLLAGRQRAAGRSISGK